MTKLEGVPDTDDVRPGMAFFHGTGPIGKTCGDCSLRGYWREGKPKLNILTGLFEERRRHWGGCRMFLKLTHSHGPAVKLPWRACKYFEAKP